MLDYNGLCKFNNIFIYKITEEPLSDHAQPGHDQKKYPKADRVKNGKYNTVK